MSKDEFIDLNDAEAADKSFEEQLTLLTDRNPDTLGKARVTLSKKTLRAMVRTFFYLGFAAGETNTLSKIHHE